MRKQRVLASGFFVERLLERTGNGQAGFSTTSVSVLTALVSGEECLLRVTWVSLGFFEWYVDR